MGAARGWRVRRTGGLAGVPRLQQRLRADELSVPGNVEVEVGAGASAGVAGVQHVLTDRDQVTNGDMDGASMTVGVTGAVPPGDGDAASASAVALGRGDDLATVNGGDGRALWEGEIPGGVVVVGGIERGG